MHLIAAVNSTEMTFVEFRRVANKAALLTSVARSVPVKPSVRADFFGRHIASETHFRQVQIQDVDAPRLVRAINQHLSVEAAGSHNAVAWRYPSGATAFHPARLRTVNTRGKR